MRQIDAEALRMPVDKLRRSVRAGDFTKSELQKEVWENRDLLPKDGFHRLSIHTLSWEYFHSRGDQDAAAARLRDGQVRWAILDLSGRPAMSGHFRFRTGSTAN